MGLVGTFFFVRNSSAVRIPGSQLRFFSNNKSPFFQFKPNSRLIAERVSLIWHRVPKLRTAPVMRSSIFNFKGSRGMATHRDVYYGSKGSGGWKGSGWFNNLYSYRGPILFATGVVAFNALVLPYIFQLPGLRAVRRNPDTVIYALMALNLAGFLAWKAGPAGYRFMSRYGLLQKDYRFNYGSMIGSGFSHQEIWHIGINMFVLYQFGIPVARWIGSQKFLETYMDGIVLSSLGSLMLPSLLGVFSNIPSLGASGAVFTTMGIFSYLAPHAKLALFFIPLPIGAWYVFLLTVAYNGAGIFLRFGSSDYAGHLAGSLAGIVWGYLISEKSKKNRQRALQKPRSQFGFF